MRERQSLWGREQNEQRHRRSEFWKQMAEQRITPFGLEHEDCSGRNVAQPDGEGQKGGSFGIGFASQTIEVSTPVTIF